MDSTSADYHRFVLQFYVTDIILVYLISIAQMITVSFIHSFIYSFICIVIKATYNN